MTAPITPHGGHGLPPMPRQVAGTVELAVEPPAAMALQPLIDGADFASSPAIGALAGALAAAQVEIGNPEKNKTAEVKSQKAQYSYGYADLASVLASVREPLGRHDLALIQLPLLDAGVVTVVTVIAHASGEWIGCRMVAAASGDERMSPVQALGSIITYLRRYSASAITGIAQEDDDAAGYGGGSRDGAGRAPRGTPSSGTVWGTPAGKRIRARYDAIITELSQAQVTELNDECSAAVNSGQLNEAVTRFERLARNAGGASPALPAAPAPATEAAREGNWWLGRPVVIGEEDGQKVYGALVAPGAGRPVPGDAIKVSMGRGKGQQRGWVVALHDENDQGVTVTTRRMSREDEQRVEGAQV